MQFFHIILYVADIQRTQTFYFQAFGLQPGYVHESGQYVELATGSTKLALSSQELANANLPQGFTPNNPQHIPAGFAVSFMVEDVPTAFASAVQAGAIVIAQPEIKPWGQHLAYVRDLDGILIELNKWVG